MALTESMKLDPDFHAPDFQLPDVVTGKPITLATFAGNKGLLVMFICRHCPYVMHVKHELARLGKDYADASLGIVAISPNDASAYPQDAPESLREMAEELGFNFPYCHDESQETAMAYKAACTPDFFLFDESRKLVYHGQLDDSRPGNGIPVTGGDLRAAIKAVLSGRPVSAARKPSIGCSIKWKPDNQPPW